MAYDSKWVRLNGAIRLVMDAEAGCSMEKAQADICQAIAERAVRFRAQLRKHANGMTSKDELEGAAFDRLTTLKSTRSALGAVPSAEIVACQVRSSSPARLVALGLDQAFQPRHRDRFVWRRASRRGRKATDSRSEGTRKKSGPGVTRAIRAIDELYPDGPPDPAILPNKPFCGTVRAKLKDLKLLDVSDDTVLRAAGRRSK
jgi:hypothetical protein